MSQGQQEHLYDRGGGAASEEGGCEEYMCGGLKARWDCADGLLLPVLTGCVVEVQAKAKCHMAV